MGLRLWIKAEILTPANIKHLVAAEILNRYDVTPNEVWDKIKSNLGEGIISSYKEALDSIPIDTTKILQHLKKYEITGEEDGLVSIFKTSDGEEFERVAEIAADILGLGGSYGSEEMLSH